MTFPLFFPPNSDGKVLEEAVAEIVIEALQQHGQEEHRPGQGKGPGSTSDVDEKDHGEGSESALKRALGCEGLRRKGREEARQVPSSARSRARCPSSAHHRHNGGCVNLTTSGFRALMELD